MICTKHCQDTNTIADLAKGYDIEALVSVSQFQSVARISSTSAIQCGRNNPFIRVILVLDNPLSDDWKSPTIVGHQTQSLLLRDVVSQQLQARNFLIDASRSHANISTLDTLEHICNDSICPVRDGKKYLYFDDYHLTEFGALKIAAVSKG